MSSLSRDQSKNRKWNRTTPYTYMLSARIPLSLMEQLRSFVDRTGASTTDVVVRALRRYLEEQQEGGLAE